MNTRTLLSRAARLLGRVRGPGYVDHFDAARVAGWAADPADPGTPALLSLHVDGEPAMNIVADLAREDVQAAGLGPLRSGFDATLPRRLRDGRAHLVELRLGLDGPVLRGGRLKIEARADMAGSEPDTPPPGQAAASEPPSGTDPAAAAAAPVPPSGAAEGVAFFDPRRAAVTGWALGTSTVLVQFDDAPPQAVVLDREVPGFGSGSRQGFLLPVPQALRDGAWHELQVRAKSGGALLDGTPLRLRVAPDQPRVEIEAQSGPRLTLGLRAPDGSRWTDPVRLLADGVPLQVQGRPGQPVCHLPEAAQVLLVTDAEDQPLARFVLTGGQPRDALAPWLAPETLEEEGLARARAAFDAFCADPDDRFDPLWFRWSHPAARDLAPEALIGAYAAAAPDGASPGPFFDEAAARALHPDLARVIAEGGLPCAFALELALGRGALGSLSGLAPALSRALGDTSGDPTDRLAGLAGAARPGCGRDETSLSAPPPPAATPLPPPTHALSPARSIYAAWVARLDIPDSTRAEIEADEHALRRDIASTALTRQPLVSIIMPSWNRAFTIGEAIQSVLDQSYGNWELLICDDASEDKTAEVVRRFDDPRIRYMKFLKSNGAGARNKGLGFARGEYIAYLDSDNIWHPQFLDLMLRKLLSAPGLAIAYAAYLDTEIDGAKVHLQTVSRPNFRPVRLASKNFMDLNTIVHHRRLYDWLGGFDGTLPRLQDWDLALRYTAIFRPAFVNRIGVFYRRNVAWGQVTHLHMNSGAQNTVNEKTRRRLEGGHERLTIPWPGRSRVTVICGGAEGHLPGPQSRSMAQSLARMAARVADVDLVELGLPAEEQAARPQDPEGLTRHSIPMALQRDPLRLGHALGALVQGRPVLSVGLRGGYLRALPGLDPRRCYRLQSGGEGALLQGLDLPGARFDLGALPLMLPEGSHDAADLVVLVMPPADAPAGLDAALQAEARRRGLVLVLPPLRGQGWQRLEAGGSQPLVPAPGNILPDLLGQVAMTVCLGPVSQLDPFGLSLLSALQGRGVPAAVLPDAGRARATGFARQWIEAKAAYELQNSDPKWVFDKIRKLLADPAGLARLQERSRTVQAIAHHPDLAEERLAHLLYRLLHDLPEQEASDARV